MLPRDRVAAALSGDDADRVPYQDAFWSTTVQRWRAEGLPADSSPHDYFGCEIARLGGDYTLQLPVENIEETERYRIYRDTNGATRKEISEGDDWTPHYLAYGIESRQDWQRLKGRAAYNESRLPASCLAAYQRARQRQQFVAFSAHACFHPTWQKIGMVKLFCAMLEDPDWIADMFSAHTDLIIGLYEGMRAQGMEFDGAFIADDLGYREAPMISPQLYHDLVQPQHSRLCERFARDGLRTILHSDGNVKPLIDDFLEAGFAALHPLEAKAGIDVGQLRQKYGARLVLFGNIDVRRLAGTREEIEDEVSTKVTTAKEGGGYIFHSDHSVPWDVSLDNYRFALQMLGKYGSYD